MGRHFLIENPYASEIWYVPSMKHLADVTGFWAYMDQCAVGLKDPDGFFTKKPTAFLGSCESMVWRLNRICPATHEHVALAGATRGIKRCAFAQAWPSQLVQLVVAGVIETLRMSARLAMFPARVAVTDSYGSSAPSHYHPSLQQSLAPKLRSA